MEFRHFFAKGSLKLEHLTAEVSVNIVQHSKKTKEPNDLCESRGAIEYVWIGSVQVVDILVAV